MDFKDKKYKILLTGGGTSGSVTPLLAIAEELKTAPQGGDFEFLWLGTKYGPEKNMVEQAGIKFKVITGGKWRRYFSLQNFSDLFKIKIAFFQSFFILLKYRPDLAISAGSFISVPVVWAAWLLGVKVLIHQQDVRPGLANKLMAPLAKIITVTFEKSLKDYGKKAIWIGNPVRKQFLNKDLKKKNNLQESLPIVLILGGGTGAITINKLVEESLSELTKFCQIIHITGKNKTITNHKSQIINYTKYEFLNLEQMARAYDSADLIVSRCGMGTLSELSCLGKPVILIPLLDSHQEDNAAIFSQAKAGVVLEQKKLTSQELISEIKKLIKDKELQKRLNQNIVKVMKQGANKAIIEIIKSLIKLS
ncbi:MAG: undecaprenyldiphospho-muramoylpentapeptide beta-N-acetylglucosaminyltransferase [Patescibacteria group bacterium]|nr:undecaprenyldiphospho-muramoylpentapeptide beta-N-acetylglucosaminyltransferase [Patescibacteria group bacterium]MBU1870523.1 undecaprenyldiphospho-muramoylpentapeptide beta-N-acetylglucosaminyltransferase [Patescibacteria group bacterium]